MAFKKGNTEGAKGRLFDAALRRAIAQDSGKKIHKAAEKLLDLAAEGEAWAVRELADRLDGKAAQSVLLDGALGIYERAADLSDDRLAEIANAGNSANKP